jgi:hypothetical protein
MIRIALMLNSARIRTTSHVTAANGHTDTEPPGCTNTTIVPRRHICKLVCNALFLN